MARNYSRQVRAREKSEAVAERDDERESINKQLSELKEKAIELKERKKSLAASGSKTRSKRAPAYSIAGDSSGRASKVSKSKSPAVLHLDSQPESHFDGTS